MTRRARDWIFREGELDEASVARKFRVTDMGLPAPHGKSYTKGIKGSVRHALALLGLIVLLGACGFTPQGNAVRQLLMEAAAKGGGAGLENAETFICELAPVGAVKQRYGGKKADAYNKLCDRGSAGNIIKPKMVEPGN